MNLPGYPKYKSSGIEWVSQIPSHWEVKKLDWLFSYAKGKNASVLTKEYIGDNPGDYPVFSGQTENGGILGFTNSHEFDFKNRVVFVTTVGAKAMSTRLVSGRFSLSQNCALIIPRNPVDIDYYEATLRGLFDYERRSISLIMQPSLRFDDLERFRVPFPPEVEQGVIGRFLRKRTTEIDALIQKNEQLIEKLHEKQSMLISRTVTRGLPPEEARAAGLNPSPRMKSPGIPWLEEMPEHANCNAETNVEFRRLRSIR